MRKAWILGLALILFFGARAMAQLPPDAVMLDKVKIPEKLKSDEFCPVYAEPSDPSLPTWEYKGVTYRGAKPDAQAKFMADPDKFAEQAREQRWKHNFKEAMSVIWCPVTDEVNPGGLAGWSSQGLKWESCCEFCESSVQDQDFEDAFERLTRRAQLSWEATGGKYTEGASSVVEGAIRDPNAPIEAAPEAAAEALAACADEPAYLAGKDLKPTYAGGIALVVENRCLNCHRTGGLAPMAFTSLGGIKKWSKNLRESITSHGMPPWPADRAVGCFSNSTALSEKEVELFVAWIGAGYPQGEGQYKSEKTWDPEWIIGKPDHVIQLPEYTIGENVTGEIHVYEVKTDFAEDRWIVGTEIIAGNDFDTISIDAGPLGFYAAGNRYQWLPEGTGRLLKAGETVKVRAHYFKEAGFESMDMGTRIGLVFAKDPGAIKHELRFDPMANIDFTIPAGAAAHEVRSRFEFASDGRVLSLNPLLHVRGKSVSYKIIGPGGAETLILSVPRWETDWKMTYRFAEPIEAPAGTVIEMTAVFDNSMANMKNPDPKAEIKAGPAGEIAEGWIGYTLD